MNHFSVSLPTKTHLKKYLQTLYGAPGHPIPIDPATDFGDIIVTKLASTLHCDLKPTDLQGRLYGMNDLVKLQLPKHYFRKLPNKDLSTHQIIRINRTVENMFERDLCDIVARAHDFLGVKRGKAIELFAENHHIELEQDITFEALVKMEYRFRNKNSRHTVRKKIVQGLSSKRAAA